MTQVKWTDDELRLLVEHWLARRLSARQIAALIPGKSRSAVIGRARRMGLSGRGGSLPGTGISQLAPAPVREDMPVPRVKLRSRREIAAKLALLMQRSRLLRGLRLRASENAQAMPEGFPVKPRVFATCQWIEDDPMLDARMCGAKTFGGAYCREHYARCYDWAATLGAINGAAGGAKKQAA